MEPARRPWRHAAGLAVAGVAIATLCLAVGTVLVFDEHPQPVEDISAGKVSTLLRAKAASDAAAAARAAAAAAAAHHSELSASKTQVTLVNEENLIKEAVHEAMDKAEAQTGYIVQRAVRDAVSKALGEVKMGTRFTHSMAEMTSAEKAKAVARAKGAEDEELRHIDVELNRELGGLLDLGTPSKGAPAAHSDGGAAGGASMAAGSGKGGLSFAQVKAVDPSASRSQYQWLKWVQSQLRGGVASSTPYDAPPATEVAKKAHEDNRAKALAAAKERADKMKESEQYDAEERKNSAELARDFPNLAHEKSENREYTREEQARLDLKKLTKKLLAQKKQAAARKASTDAERHQGQEELITKELRALSAKKRQEQVAEAKVANRRAKPDEDRDAMAEKYLHLLKHKEVAKSKLPEWKTSSLPVTSRKNPAYIIAQEKRDEQAKLDMKMLSKDAVLVSKGDKLEPVKLSPRVVHGINKLRKERQVVDAQKEAEKKADHDRNVIAQHDLKALRAQPAIGKPFHKIPLPSALLHPVKTNMNAVASHDLKLLAQKQKEDQPSMHSDSKAVNRNVLAEKYLHSLEHKVGKAAIPSHPPAPLTADGLAQKDLKTLPAHAAKAPVVHPAQVHPAKVESKVA